LFELTIQKHSIICTAFSSQKEAVFVFVIDEKWIYYANPKLKKIMDKFRSIIDSDSKAQYQK